MPPHKDFGFYQHRKHDKWREVPAPSPRLEAPIADTHAHVHMLPDPSWELKRAAANGVQLISCVGDPTEDILGKVFSLSDGETDDANLGDSNQEDANQDSANQDSANQNSTNQTEEWPRIVYSLGVHPHNAKDYSPEVEARLIEGLAHPDARVLGEIGLDYYYDLSPRDMQKEIFRRQIRLAKDKGLPIALHLRSGEDLETDNAHREALEILQDEDFPADKMLLHCCSLTPEQLKPWIDSNCYIAYGGAFTFKKSTEARQAAHLVARDRLLFETDAPYMAPEPMRGTTCTPAHTIFTAAMMADELGFAPGDERKQFLEDVWDNSNRFFGLSSD